MRVAALSIYCIIFHIHYQFTCPSNYAQSVCAVTSKPKPVPYLKKKDQMDEAITDISTLSACARVRNQAALADSANRSSNGVAIKTCTLWEKNREYITSTLELINWLEYSEGEYFRLPSYYTIDLNCKYFNE